jgi:hypothetical protein
MKLRELKIGDYVIIRKSVLPFLSIRHKDKFNGAQQITRIDYDAVVIDKTHFKSNEIERIVTKEKNPEYFL